MKKTAEAKSIVKAWLASRKRSGKISRNTIAVGLVVLDRLKTKCPLAPDELFSAGGELKGSRSGLPAVLERYGLPRRFLKEATTRQSHQDARLLAERLGYGGTLSRLDSRQRDREFVQALSLLTAEAQAWLSRQPIRVVCQRHLSPVSWIDDILQKAQGRSGGVVEQHLVGAKLQRRHPTITVPNHPGHAGDLQTKRFGDFSLKRVGYHVTATEGTDALRRCAEQIGDDVHQVVLVPRRLIEKAKWHAETLGVEKRITILSIEDFLGQNVIELATETGEDFFTTLRVIVEEYNKRLREAETDLSLLIQLQ